MNKGMQNIMHLEIIIPINRVIVFIIGRGRVEMGPGQAG